MIFPGGRGSGLLLPRVSSATLSWPATNLKFLLIIGYLLKSLFRYSRQRSFVWF